MFETQHVTFSAGSGHLDRAAHLRDIADDLMLHRRAALLPSFHGKLLIDTDTDEPRLGWVPPLPDYIREATDQPIFLGMSGDTPCFAADFTAMEEDIARDRFCEGADFMDLRRVAAELGPASASIAATAKAVLGWHASHQFCSNCGHRTLAENGGWRRACPNCGTKHFPRTDPVVIMLVLFDDEVLLGRQSKWANGVYSLLAGFVEPGETIEDAVRRETKEETAVEVGAVSYVACQPWPYPTNLMIGCVGIAESKAITVDKAELEDAQWISRAKMAIILDDKHPRLNPPRKDAIARSLLADWVNGRIAMP